MLVTFCELDNTYAKCDHMASMNNILMCVGDKDFGNCAHSVNKKYKIEEDTEINSGSELLDELKEKRITPAKYYGMIVNSESHIHTGLTVKIIGETEGMYILAPEEYCNAIQKDAIGIINKDTFDFLQERSNRIKSFIDENSKGQS